MMRRRATIRSVTPRHDGLVVAVVVPNGTGRQTVVEILVPDTVETRADFRVGEETEIEVKGLPS